MSQGQGRHTGGATDEDLDGDLMLVLGERRPDVEDTTLEELRRDREQLRTSPRSGPATRSPGGRRTEGGRR